MESRDLHANMSNTLFGLRQTISKSSLCGELKSFDPWREVAPSLEETKEIGPEGALLWPALPRQLMLE